jgi:hypothetical protein
MAPRNPLLELLELASACNDGRFAKKLFIEAVLDGSTFRAAVTEAVTLSV